MIGKVYRSDEPSHAFGLLLAFDLDALFWPGRDFITLRFLTDQTFYLGVKAVLRKHFGTVLNFLFNSDHHDHLHVDDGSEVGFVRSSDTAARFPQKKRALPKHETFSLFFPSIDERLDLLSKPSGLGLTNGPSHER